MVHVRGPETRGGRRLGLSRNDQFIRPAMMPRYDCDEETDPEGRVPDADDDNFFD